MTDLELAKQFDLSMADVAPREYQHRGPLTMCEKRPAREIAFAVHPNQVEERNATLRHRGVTSAYHDPKTGKLIISSMKAANRILRDYVEGSPYNPYT